MPNCAHAKRTIIMLLFLFFFFVDPFLKGEKVFCHKLIERRVVNAFYLLSSDLQELWRSVPVTNNIISSWKCWIVFLIPHQFLSRDPCGSTPLSHHAFCVTRVPLSPSLSPSLLPCPLSPALWVMHVGVFLSKHTLRLFGKNQQAKIDDKQTN